VLVICAFRLQLIRRHDGDELIALNFVALLYQNLTDTSANLGSNNHILRRDNPGQNQRCRLRPGRIVRRPNGGDQQQQDQNTSHASPRSK